MTTKQDYAERYAAKPDADTDMACKIGSALHDAGYEVMVEPPRSTPISSFWIIYNADESICIRVYKDCSMRISVDPEHRAQVCRAIAELEG